MTRLLYTPFFSNTVPLLARMVVMQRVEAVRQRRVVAIAAKLFLCLRFVVHSFYSSLTST